MALLDESANGVFIIAATPFSDRGALDLASVDRMVDFYLELGANGLTILGVMGEASKLTEEELRAFISRAIVRARGAPVIVGVSAPGLASIKTLALQDYPLATQVQISPKVILRIVEALPSCVMLKHEDWPGLAKITAVRAASDRGARCISILTGNGGLFLPEELERGADGAMTGFAFPEMMVGVVKAFRAGDPERARDIFDAYLPLARYEQQPGLGLAVRKYILAKRGAIASPALRRPGAALSPADIAEVERLIGRQTRRLQEIG